MPEYQSPAAGWYADPQGGPGLLRYWDGANWTPQTASVGQPAMGSVAPPIAEGKGSGKAIASLVLGIIGLVAWFIPLFGLPISVTGLILGATATKSARRKMAIIGVVLCAIALALTCVNAAWGAYLGATGQLPLAQWLRTTGQ